jgi:hypothetical protein
MDVGTFRDGFQWHRPLGEVGRWRFARWAAGFMPIRYDGVLARSLPHPTRL